MKSTDTAVVLRALFASRQAQHKGRPLSVVNALPAATALQYDLTIVSRNVSDFSVVELAVLNPWDART